MIATSKKSPSLRCFGQHGSPSKRSAFTLIELAIVLGLMSVLLAVIWVAAGAVWDGYKFERTTRQVMDVVNNMRSYYGTNAGFNNLAGAAGPDGIDITAAADAADVIPREMRLTPAVAGGDINHGLSVLAGGSFHLFKLNAGTNDRFRLQLLGLDKQTCAKLLMQFPVTMPEIGVVRFGTAITAIAVNARNVVAPGGATPLPLLIATAEAWCNNAGVNNRVNIDFLLRN